MDLKPCPFCGSEAEIIKVGIQFKIRCKKWACEASNIKFDSLNMAIETWNTRTSGWVSVDDELPEALTSVLVNISNDRVKNDVSEAYHRQNGAFVPQYELGKNGLKAGDCEGVTHWMPLPQMPEVK